MGIVTWHWKAPSVGLSLAVYIIMFFRKKTKFRYQHPDIDFANERILVNNIQGAISEYYKRP